MKPRTLHCANARLHLGFALLVAAAAAYAITRQGADGLQQWGAAAAAMASLAWGGYYATLQYVIDTRGITRKLFWHKRQRLEWNALAHAEAQETATQEMSSCSIILTAASGQTMRLSSDLLPLDDMQQLTAEMRAAGLLSPQQ